MNSQNLNSTASELLTPEKASRFTGLSQQTLANMRCTGRGPAFHKIGAKYVRYDTVDLDQWMRSRRFHSTSEASAA